jgi:hypothetical protein
MAKKFKPTTPEVIPSREANTARVTEVRIRRHETGVLHLSVQAEIGDDTDPDNFVVIRKVHASSRDDGSAWDDTLNKNASNQSSVIDNLFKAAFAVLEEKGKIGAGTLE